MKRATWTVAGLAVLMAGCSATAPTANQNTPAQPAAQATSDRAILADGQMTADQLMQNLPKRLTQAEGDRILVDLPADKIKGDLQVSQDGRSVQQWGYRRYYGYGGYYYPYYRYGGYYYPYYNYYRPYYYYPYYYGYGSYYYPYRYYGYRRYW